MASEDLIHLLPDSVANQIAAGEVIQRPASVVKELVENSVDAGATSIQVRLTDAGRTNIQVIDNGKGMSETDARMAFERHATSKISTPSDLFALHTFGFRGEALASIAAVAQVELRTRREEDDLGTVIHLAGSRLESQEAAMCPVGTNFQVKNLFFNVPARRKFLKSDQTEMNNVLAEIERVALVHPEIAFAVYRNDVELINVPQTTLRQRIQHLFGKKLGQELLSVEVDTTLVKVTGCVGIPESARKKGAHCFFFVNGRYMRHPYFHKAVMEAYAHLIPSTEQVPYFLYFTVDPSRIDVNIHPTKTEIKFEDEQAIWQILMASVREVLGRSNAAPSIDFDVADCPDIPVYTSDKTPLPPSPSADTTYNPFKQGGAPGYKRTPLKWEDLYGDSKASMPEFDEPNTPAISQDNLLWESDAPQRREAVDTEDLGQGTQLFDSEISMQESCAECYQYKGRYIVTSMKSGLMLVDQHRAHVRILFERYMAQMGGRPGVCQGMLFPETVNVPMAQVAYMDQLLEDFSRLGFDINSLGGGTYAIQGVPEGVAGLKPSDLVLEMLSGALERGSVSKDDIHYGLALTMARASALVVGEVLAPSEMAHLIDDLFACEMPGYTPEGKRVFIIIDDGDIDARFR